MKFFKKKNLLNVLYAVLIALPLFSILGRVLYTQWNQNAKDSYSGSSQTTINYKYQTNEIDDSTDLVVGNIYDFDLSRMENVLFNTDGELVFDIITGYIRMYGGNYNIDETNYPNDDDIIFTNRQRILLSSDYAIFNFGPADYLDNYFAEWYTAIYFDDDLNDVFETNNLIIQLVSFQNLNDNTVMYVFNESTYNEIASVDITSNTLDNAFDYSISQFVSENDFGKLNFFTWFSDLFLSNNSVNNLYIHFVNWYLNYTLYVSLGYILWLVLMWFVSFIRRLLEKTSTYETGGF